jgi:hypothetical protein
MRSPGSRPPVQVKIGPQPRHAPAALPGVLLQASLEVHPCHQVLLADAEETSSRHLKVSFAGVEIEDQAGGICHDDVLPPLGPDELEVIAAVELHVLSSPGREVGGNAQVHDLLLIEPLQRVEGGSRAV